MNALGQLLSFYNAISDDNRIGTAHISLYLSLFRTWVLNGCQNPVLLDRVAIMRVAKISSRDTYSRILLDLHRYGYVQYVPSFNCLFRSKVFIGSLPVI